MKNLIAGLATNQGRQTVAKSTFCANLSSNKGYIRNVVSASCRSKRPHPLNKQQKPLHKKKPHVKAVKTGRERTHVGYTVTEDEKHIFRTQGFVHLKSVLTAEEVEEVIEPFYVKFMNREVAVKDKDYCDMSGVKGRTPDQYTIHNAMLPRIYLPEIQGNIFELRCQEIADQLCDGGMGIDYDQILAKRPETEDSIFAWHQDLAYWPITKAETTSATCWLAVDYSTRENGCMRFIPGSHLEPKLRPHTPVDPTRKDSHVLSALVMDDDLTALAEINIGDITVHNERVVHGSGPNTSKRWRRAYVLAFRKKDCIAEERAMGFTHSHNDVKSWDVFHQHQ